MWGVSLLLLCLVTAGRAAGAQQRNDVAPPVRLDQEFPTLVEVELVGLESYSPETVLRVLGLEIGKPMRTPRIRDAFRGFGLVITDGGLEQVEGGIRQTLLVRELPYDIEPSFLGNDTYDLDKINEWAGIGTRDFIYSHEADQVVNRLEEAYRAQGFHHVEVDWVAGPGGESATEGDIIFVIREGPKVRCTGLIINGNEALPDTGFWIWSGGLRRLANVQTSGRGIFSWFGGVFREDQLNADLQAMRQAYRDRGYLDVKVALDRFEWNKKRNRVKIHVIVDEGALWTVGSLEIKAYGERPGPDGLGSDGRVPAAVDLEFPLEELLEKVQMKVGEPYESGRLANDARVLTEHYGSNGYLAADLFENPRTSGGFAFLDPERIEDPRTNQVHITYWLVQGSPRFLREVQIAGNENTRDRVIRSRIQIRPGEVIDQAKLVRARRQLVGTGYFSNQQDPTHPQPRYTLRGVEGEPDQVDVLFEVEQGLVVNATLSGGATSDGGLVGIASASIENFDITALPSGIFSAFGEIFSKRAFHGAGQSLSVEVSPGSEVDQFSLSFNEPDIFGRHFNPTGAGFALSGRERRFRTNDENRVRFNPFLSHVFGDGDFSGRVGVIWQRVRLREFDQSTVLPSTLLNSPSEADYLGLNFDLRWTTLDNRLNPRNGQFTRLTSTVFGGPFGQDVDLVRTELFHDRYVLFGQDGDPARWGLYTGFALGLASPFSDTDFVPFSERFFLGGSSNLRGFRFRGVGPNEGDSAVGGETMIRGTLELRRPLYSTPLPGTTLRQEVIRAGPFVDFGVLNRRDFELDLDDLRASVGFSVGLTNPIPLVFNFGWPIMEDDGDRTQVFTFRLSLR